MYRELFYVIKKKELQYAISIYLREIDGIQKRGTGREEGRQGTVIHPAALPNGESPSKFLSEGEETPPPRQPFSPTVLSG